MNVSDPDLVRRAKGGDRTAFEVLFRKYQDRMYAISLHFTRSPELAADVTQDAFVNAWEQLPSLRHDGAFSGWLRTIVLNRVRDALRSRPPADTLDHLVAEAMASDGPEPEAGAVEAELATAVRRAVLTLPEHQRTVVLMHHLEGMSVEQIGAALGLKKGTVISRLARGRAMLRHKLAGRV